MNGCSACFLEFDIMPLPTASPRIIILSQSSLSLRFNPGGFGGRSFFPTFQWRSLSSKVPSLDELPSSSSGGPSGGIPTFPGGSLFLPFPLFPPAGPGSPSNGARPFPFSSWDGLSGGGISTTLAVGRASPTATCSTLSSNPAIWARISANSASRRWSNSLWTRWPRSAASFWFLASCTS
ncbi:unnamed protein product [Tuber melanosporum]|uniref:(Perigord truffle) hypothetical protein n=1 Tax=Tuber melanosporum (strain Mel28) TaxID=656061 RepID=D5G6K3_TUBMM|nr:uncharacterized protein GSTUM_00001802001 [Tuber melanosporum]CAZ80146.1 unnamed protein product [Tuber melanosporum]